MTTKLKYRLFAEWNRDGELEKIETMRIPPDHTSVVAIHEQEQFIDESGAKKWKPVVKVFEHIFIRDEEPPTGHDPVIKFESSLIQSKPNEPVVIKATITDADGNDTIKEIVWLQMMGTAAPFVVADDKKSITVTPSAEGDYTFSCTATDNTDRVGTKLCNLKVRTVPDPEPSDFTPLMAAFGDSNSSPEAAKTFNNINALNVGVKALGDYEYDSDFNDFKSKYQNLKSKTLIAYKGNHDDTESESQAIADANKAYWSWENIAAQSAAMGNIGLVSLDTQDPKITDKGGAQYQFVEKTLQDFAANPNIDFIIVGSHKPFYCPTSKHGEETKVRAVYQPLFDKYGVDIVDHGHNHIAATSYPITIDGQALYTEKGKGVYDFTKPHGQIYVTAGNSGESIYKIDSNPAYIRFSNDKDFGYLIIGVANDTNKKLQIKHVNNNGQVLDSVIIDKTGDVPTGPLPPVIDAGENENVFGNINEDVQTSVTITDPNGNETIQSINWVQVAGPSTSFAISPDKLSIVVNTAIADVYKFQVTATDDTGLIDTQDMTVTIREKPPEPTGNVIFDSHRDTKLHDGKVRTITQEGDLSAGGLGVECRASGNPRIIVNADGTFTLKCDQGFGRIYVYALNYNCTLEAYVKLSASVDNFSLKTRSRHNEGGDCSNRFGGFGDATDRDTSDMKTESCHNNHENGKTIDFNPNLQTGKKFGIRYECKNIENDTQVQFTQWIDYMDGKGWIQNAQHKHATPQAFYMDKESFKKQSYFWLRLNGAGTIDFDYVKLIDLDKPAE